MIHDKDINIRNKGLLLTALILSLHTVGQAQAADISPARLVVNASEDAYLGDAQFSLKVDGMPVGGINTVKAQRKTNQSQDFTFDISLTPGTHIVTVNFLNDKYHGRGKDRNLFVNSMSLAGVKSVFNKGQWSRGPVDYKIAYTPAVPVNKPAMFGVNLSGGEGGTVPGKIFWNYTYPKVSDIDLAFDNGVRFFRFPLREERAQDGLKGPLRAEVAANIYPVIDYILSKSPDTNVLIDWHSFGSRGGVAYGTAPWDSAAIVDLNSKFIGKYNGNKRVLIGLQNEPVHAGAGWWPAAQSVVNGLRAAKVTNTIVVAGDGWSSAESWASNNGPQARKFTDPLKNVMFEAHTYFDTWSSGTEVACKAGTETRLDPLTKDAEAGGYKVIVGELAFGAGANCDTVRKLAIAKIQASKSIYAASFWTMGDFYVYPNYMYGLTGPVKGKTSVLFDAIIKEWKK